MRGVQLTCLVAKLAACALAQAQPKIEAVVNAASFSTNIANASIISIFGTGLATSSASASGTSLPSTLGGASVSLCRSVQANSCEAAKLVFAGPGQINAVLPFLLGAGSHTADLIVTVAGASTARYSVTLLEQATGIFQMGWDCSYPATCAVSQVKTANATVLRGSLTDAAGRLVTSQNPITINGSYVMYFTGGAFVPDGFARGPAVYSYLTPSGKKARVIAFPTYYGHSPCCSGLDQLNFSLPGDLLRGFSSDGESVPACSTFQFPMRLEMLLLIAGTSNDSSSDSVSVPVLLNKGDVYCEQ